MRKEKVLIDPADGSIVKRVLASGEPSAFFPAATGLGSKILHALAVSPDYPSNIARGLKVYHQTVYYHMSKLEHAGLIRKVGKKVVRGGSAHLYALASDGYAVEFDVKGERFNGYTSTARSRSLGRFLGEFVSGEEFDGWIVIGSPEPHGPNRTQGRDGHYAIQLGFALGQFVRLPRLSPAKLDVDLKIQKLEQSNLMIVGGPRTNIISSEVNKYLPVRFSEASFWGSIVDDQGQSYLSDKEALIAKIRNPWNEKRCCVVAAGLSGSGTKAAIIGMTNMADQVLGAYAGGDYAVVLRGVDLDGDGKVDSVEVLYRTGR